MGYIALLAGVTKSMKLTICGGSPSLWFKTMELRVLAFSKYDKKLLYSLKLI